MTSILSSEANMQTGNLPKERELMRETIENSLFIGFVLLAGFAVYFNIRTSLQFEKRLRSLEIHHETLDRIEAKDERW